MLVVELNFKDPLKVNPFILQWRSKHKKDVMDNGPADVSCCWPACDSLCVSWGLKEMASGEH